MLIKIPLDLLLYLASSNFIDCATFDGILFPPLPVLFDVDAEVLRVCLAVAVNLAGGSAISSSSVSTSSMSNSIGAALGFDLGDCAGVRAAGVCRQQWLLGCFLRSN